MREGGGIRRDYEFFVDMSYYFWYGWGKVCPTMMYMNNDAIRYPV